MRETQTHSTIQCWTLLFFQLEKSGMNTSHLYHAIKMRKETQKTLASNWLQASSQLLQAETTQYMQKLRQYSLKLHRQNVRSFWRKSKLTCTVLLSWFDNFDFRLIFYICVWYVLEFKEFLHMLVQALTLIALVNLFMANSAIVL